MKRIHDMYIGELGEAQYYLEKVIDSIDENYHGYKELKKAHDLIKKVEDDYELDNEITMYERP